MKEFFNNHRIESVWKTESAKIVAALTRMVRDISMAKDLAQYMLIIALERCQSLVFRITLDNGGGLWLKEKPLAYFVGKNYGIKNGTNSVRIIQRLANRKNE